MRTRLLNIAHTETASARHLAQLDADFAQRHVVLRDAVPAKFLELVDAVRNSVREFNRHLVDAPGHPLPRLQWYETPNISLRDPVTGDGMRIRVQRQNSYFDLLLRMVQRAGKEDIPIIEGYGSLGREVIRTETLMRVEGFVDKGVARFRLTQDFKRVDIDLAEIPDRIVMAVASHDYTLLTRAYPLPINPRTPDEESDSGAPPTAASETDGTAKTAPSA